MPTKKRIQYRYTSTGQRSVMIDPDGGRFSYSYDSVKRLTRVINPEGQRTSFAYDNAGRRTVKKLANGSRTSFSYDAANRITSVAQLKSDGSVQAKYEYKYDRAGNRTAMAETGHTTARTTWSYDAAYQLTGENRTGANAYRNTYVYDNRGNRTLKNLDGTRTTSSYDDANQLKWTQDGSGRTTYTFDADGNQQVVLTPAGQRTTSVWDYENKLVGVLNPSGTRETMAYDPDGKRVKHQTASETAKYVWDNENYLAETNASDVTQAVYTNEPRTYGNLISQRKSGATHYYVFDALGSTRLLIDSSEAVSESLLYDAWGNLVGSAPSMAVPFRWVGELGYLFVPSTADYYVRARVYRPGIGRWTSVDPAIAQWLNADMLFAGDKWELYDYAQNRSISAFDPTGEITVTPVATMNALGSLPCGATSIARWDFALDAPHERDGFLIQRVEVNCVYGRCGREDEGHRQHYAYYEAWFVPAGQTTPRSDYITPIVDAAGNQLGTAVDNAVYSSEASGWGMVEQKGEIRFYYAGRGPGEVHSTAALGDMFIPRGMLVPRGFDHAGPMGEGTCATTAGFLPRRREGRELLPLWRDFDPVEGPAYRWLFRAYDCCPDTGCHYADAHPAPEL